MRETTFHCKKIVGSMGNGSWNPLDFAGPAQIIRFPKPSGRLVGQLAGWMVGWLVGWSVSQLVGGWVGWLVGTKIPYGKTQISTREEKICMHSCFLKRMQTDS